MKQFFLFALILSTFFAGTLSAQKTEAEVPAAVADADNPGMGLLDQATDAKLRANNMLDLEQVIVLCQRAKRTGLSGENLEYCNQLLASSQLQRGLFFAQSLLGPANVRPRDIEPIRERALLDLEEAVTIIKDQPNAYLRIAQLNLLSDGHKDKAKEALNLAIQCAKDEPDIQILAVRMLADLEPDAEKRSAILAAAAKDGNPQIRFDYAAQLLELKRNDEALNVLKNLLETESSIEWQNRVVALLSGFREHKLAMDILDMHREKETDERKDRIDVMKAELLAKMGQYDEAIELLDSLHKKYQGQPEHESRMLILRSALHLERENFEAAMKDVEAAEKTFPDFVPLWEQKYRILIGQEKFNDALAVTKKLQTMEPEIPLHALREVHVLTELQKYDEALEAIQNIRKKYPDGESLWIMTLVEIYSEQKAYDKALDLIEEQLKAEPDELRWIANKTKILSDQEKWDEAVNWLESCLQKKGDSEEINLLLIEVLANKKNYKAAKERLKPFLEKTPQDTVLLRMDSQLSISLGFHADAVEALTKVVETSPEDYTSINNLAWLLCTSPVASVRNGSRAVELAEKAGRLSNYKRAFVLSTLAAAYAEAGDFDKAKEWSQKSIKTAKTERSKTEEERKELLEHLQEEWDCYQRNEPYRERLEEEKE